MPNSSHNSPENSQASREGTLTSATDGGIAGEHPSLPTRELLVGPTTQSEFNTVKAGLIPFACWGVNDLRFQFGSSFVTPGIQEELQTLNELIHKHTMGALKPPLSIFGHADPVGQDAFNKVLSGRRAQAIYGLLTRKTELWEELFTHPQGEDRWGDPEIDIMLTTVVSSPENASSSESETPSQDTPGPSTRTERIEAFQAEHGLVVDGVVGPNTRKELFRAYMDTLCGDLVVDPSEFLGKGQDPKGKADYQGCSEFNPLLIFSQEEQEKFQQAQDKTERNTENSSNRRVMVFLFRPGTEVTPAKWPCPRVSEGTNDCTKRFWSDGEERRTRRDPDTRREFGESQDTFACRFYDRLSNKSPCESILSIIRIRLFDRNARPLPFAPCLITQPGKEPRPDRASGTISNEPSGSTPDSVDKQDAFVTLRGLKVPAIVNVKWSRPKSEDGPDSPLPAKTDEFEFELDVAIDIPEDKPEDASLIRLKNMGYVRGPEQEDDIREFQRDYKSRFPDIENDGTLNAATQEAIEEAHDTCDLVLKGQR